MERLLDFSYRMLRAAYQFSVAAFRLVDLLWSVAAAAVKVGGGSFLAIVLALSIQAATGYAVYRCLFPPELPPNNGWLILLTVIVRNAPVISAFVVFAVGESAVVIIIGATLDSIFTFRLNFILGSRDDDAEGLYSPIGEGPGEPDDPLTF